MGGRGTSGGKNTASNYTEQKFKRTFSGFSGTKYESELFKIRSYTRNTSGTSWKESGYVLEIIGKHGVESRFDTLRDAKAFVNSEQGQEWYRKNRRS